MQYVEHVLRYNRMMIVIIPMKVTGNIIDNLDDQQLSDTLLSLSALADPLTRRIMAKLASKHSPIAVNAIPTEKLQASSPDIISRLCRLESYGFVTSIKKTDNGSFYRVYSLNSTGQRVVKNHMATELEEFQ